jgi:type 1 glutamine amidotransferase
MSDVTDDDTAQRRATGILALQLHAGPPMKVQFRNIRLKQLKAASAAAGSVEKKKIVFLPGKPSHGYGAHEHRAGCMLLAKALNASGLPVEAVVNMEVHAGGWPTDSNLLASADTIVSYCDGGAKHPFSTHLPEIDALMKKGVGLACIHYSVEAPKAETSPQENLGAEYIDWTGGYFEPYWSVNPHWTADYKQFPDHPISRGVKPFTINDEWYYHMRFRAGMDGVTPILAALPPESSLARTDGPHSGNPDVRAEVKNGQPQYMSWARERPDGGRGFGFTGGHDHWNWGNNDFRKLVLNAIVWTAKADVPAEGVSSQPPTVDDLLANLDKKPIPANFNPAGIQAMLDKWNGK